MSRIYLPGRSDRMTQLLYRYPLGLNTVLLIHSDDTEGSQTFVDSINAREITAVGDVKHTHLKQKFGASSIYFDGNDSLTLADNADWDCGVGDFSIDFWINFDDVSNPHGICGHYKADNFYWGLYWTTATGGGFRFRNMNGVIDDEVSFPFSAVVNTWYHVAIVRGWDGDGILWNCTKNGTKIGMGALKASVNMAPTNDGLFRIGQYLASSGTCNLRGYIDEFRMKKGSAAWTDNFTVPKGMYI